MKDRLLREVEVGDLLLVSEKDYDTSLAVARKVTDTRVVFTYIIPTGIPVRTGYFGNYSKILIEYSIDCLKYGDYILDKRYYGHTGLKKRILILKKKFK